MINLDAHHAFVETIKETNRDGKSLVHPEFNEFSTVYTFSTENLKGYIDKLSVNEKEILTVTGSGDQMINLALAGAKRVDNFDVNQNTVFFTELKVAALKTLSYDEFLTYFTTSASEEIKYLGLFATTVSVDKNDQAFDYQTYMRIRTQLPEVCAEYWDLIYQEYEYNGVKLRSSGLFDGCARDSAIRNNEYLESEEKYNLASMRINRIEYDFYNSDILNIHTIPHKYDIIMLSNIYIYLIGDWYKIITGDEYSNYIVNELPQILNEDGIVNLAYQYNYRENKAKSEIKGNALQRLFANKYNFSKIDAFEKFGFKKILFPSVTRNYRNLGTMDCAYLYEFGRKK